MDHCFDIHAHLLPGVDDGAADMPMAIDMLAMYRRQGVTDIMVTPHSYAVLEHPGRTREQFRLLCEQAKAHFPDITLYLGSEILFTAYDLEANLRHLRAGRLPSLNGTRYVLTEFFPDASQAEVREIIRRLLEENWIPVIAHAERIRACFADLAFSRDMIAQGALIQINAFSLEKESNTPIRLTARRLLANGLVHFIGSDAHRTTHRPPDVAAGAAHIRAHSMQAEDILHGNAQRAFAAPAPHP